MDHGASVVGSRRDGARALFETPDYFILGGAGLSFLFSIWLWFSGEQDAGLFVGLWVPSIIGLGAYVKAAFNGVRS
jgi:hypothetical protein